MPALLQALPEAGNKQANLETIDRHASVAAAAEAEFVCFPELFLTGYNLGSALRDLAEPADGPSVRRMSEIATRHGVGLIVGMPERDGDRVYNSAVAVDARGRVAGMCRKFQLFGAVEPEIFAPGADLTMVTMGARRIGLLICYDVEFPELSRALARKGAEIICAPTANMTPYFEVPTTLVRARALENGIPFIYANFCSSEGDLAYTGLSGIVGFDGMDRARAGKSGEAFLHASFDDLSAPADHPLRSTQLRDLRLDALGAVQA
ncbi:MAG: carbon-nitrogen hydrolase [Alphaproteobacteria bacterium HGW-Alphaproteobacteria-2]|nr:MAG: carbon-nitrogen hydrolase [Alphaproteobacteria bacterium HGW-Alphaproteobacteria-2]